MLKQILVSYAVMFLVICSTGCNAQSTKSEYPPVLPIWIVEDDPTMTIFERKDLERDRKVGEILVIPVYMYYEHDDATDTWAIAHPFVYQPGEEIEKQLSSFGQRDKLRWLVFWAPGYFPDGMGRTFPWVPIINDKRMIVLEMQKCIGSEEEEINSAMKDLLLGGGITVGQKVSLKAPPPPYAPAKMSEDRYDMFRLVRSIGYDGRYYYRETPKNGHLLWALNPGTQVNNRLSDDEKKIVAAFAAKAAEKPAEQTSTDQSDPRK